MAGADGIIDLCGLLRMGLVLTVTSISETCCGAASYDALVA